MTRVKIGLEVHVYLLTRSKLFCACSADVLGASEPNVNLCPTCSGQPGSKPMAPNAEALRAAVRVARALGSRVEPRARFLRKHYFYPDMPSNYQRTSEPVARGGSLEGVELTEMHVEEDPGAYDLDSGLVDYNRAGAPLLEIVTEPQFDSPAHARRFLDELRLVLRYLGANRDEAGLKADCNVSTDGGERVEIKNVNSVRNVERALEGEVARETRGFDEASGRSTRLRSKETEADYRYMPDPDLAPVDVARVAAALEREESPLERRARVARLAGVAVADASPLFEERAIVDAFEAAAAVSDARLAFDWFVRDVRADLAFVKKDWASSRLRAEDVGAMLAAVRDKRITPKVATRIQREAIAGADLRTLLAAETQHSSATGDDAVARAARAAVAANPKAVADYRAGKATAVNFLVGAAMRELKGRAPADAVRAAVEQALRDAPA